MYPEFTISRIENPNRFYAVPLIGILVKFIMLIPCSIFAWIIAIAAFVHLILNSLLVLFTGKYWDATFNFYDGYLKYNAKLLLFISGLTDTYPGFDFKIKDGWTLNISKPTNPSRIFALPLLGIIFRGILMIPFSIFTTVIYYAAWIGGSFYASFSVLFKGVYPESIFQLMRDYIRLSLASSVYFAGISDKYPSFQIDWSHKNIKIVLIILSGLLMFGNFISSFMDKSY